MSGRNAQPRCINRTKRKAKKSLWERTFKLDPMNLWADAKAPQSHGQAPLDTKPDHWERLRRQLQAEG